MMTFLSKKSHFHFLLILGHLQGPGVSLVGIMGGALIDPLLEGAGLARGLYRPPPS